MRRRSVEVSNRTELNYCSREKKTTKRYDAWKNERSVVKMATGNGLHLYRCKNPKHIYIFQLIYQIIITTIIGYIIFTIAFFELFFS